MPKLRHAVDHKAFPGRDDKLGRFTGLPGERWLVVAAILTGHPGGLFRSLIAMPSVAQRRRRTTPPARPRG